jgi:hypothetical protein
MFPFSHELCEFLIQEKSATVAIQEFAIPARLEAEIRWRRSPVDQLQCINSNNSMRGQIMNTIRTTIVDGYVHVPVPDELPNGTEVEVKILPLTSESKPGDGDWDNSPEGIEAWMKQYDAIEPLILTESDRAAMTSARQEKKAWEKSRFSEQADEQRKLWE